MKEKIFRKGSKKRLFSTVLAMVMAFTLMPMNSSLVVNASEPNAPHTTALSTSGGILTSGNYYLATDVTLSNGFSITNGNTVNVCLNGHVLKGANGSSVFNVSSGAVLNIYDCNTNLQHRFTVTSDATCWTWDDTATGGTALDDLTSIPNSGVIIVNGGCITGGTGNVIQGSPLVTAGGGININGGAVNLYAGNIVGNNTALGSGANGFGYGGGGVNIQSGTFTMNGGTIAGNYTARDGGGVNLAGSSSTFNFNGGKIVANYATGNGMSGGAIFMSNQSSFNMTGGEIKYNKCTNLGGGIFTHDNTVFSMIGGEISGNIANGANAGGVYIRSNATATLGGTAVIRDNKANNINNNLYIGSDTKYINLNSPAAEMSVGVTTNTAASNGNPRKFVATGGDSTNYQYFTADRTNEIVVYCDGSKDYAGGQEMGGLHTNHSANSIWLSLHVHDWKYSTNGDKIEAYCGNVGCGHSASDYTTAKTDGKLVSLTLSTSNPIVGDSSTEPTITYGGVQEQSDWTAAGLTPPSNLTKKYYNTDADGNKASELSGAPTEAGKYIVGVTFNGYSNTTVFLPYNVVPAAPTGLGATEPTYVGGNDGKITGVNETMEYSTDDGASWKSVTGTEITGLSAGDVKVRVKATGTTPEGAETDVTVPDGTTTYDGPAAPTISDDNIHAPQFEDGSDGEITGVNETMEYSTDGGATWTPVTGDKITGLSAGTTVQVRVRKTETEKEGLPAILTIPEASGSLPENLKKVEAVPTTGDDTDDGKITGLDNTMEYCIGDGIWKTVQDTQTELANLPAGTVVRVRIKASENGETSSGYITLTIGTKKAPSNNNGGGHVHEFEWGNWNRVTKDENGTMVYQCKLCGYVLEKEYIPAYAYTCLTESEHVLKTPQNGSVVCEMGRWNAYPRWFFEKLATRPDVNITLKFLYQHKQYTVYIPAGTKIDTEHDWYGPLKICSLYKFEVK